VHLVGLIIRIYHDARSPERQIHDRITDCDSFDARSSLDFADKKNSGCRLMTKNVMEQLLFFKWLMHEQERCVCDIVCDLES